MARRALVAIGVAVIGMGWLAWAQQPAGSDQLKALAKAALSPIAGEFRLPGLRADVQVLRDRWGVPHIYAQNVDDLFMAQGYVMAQDRLWQMEMWRRQREGRLAEILGSSAAARDKTARLLKYRGLHGVRGRHQRVHHGARVQPAGRLQADRHRSGPVDRRDGRPSIRDIRRRVGGTDHGA